MPLSGKIYLLLFGGYCMKKVLFLFLSVLVLTACGNKVDEEALEKISQALENRWEYTEKLPDEISLEDLEVATRKELDILEKYDADQFKDTRLYILYDNYRRQLEQDLLLLVGADITSDAFTEKWAENREKRAKHLYDINSDYQLNISDGNNVIFEDVLALSVNLVKVDEVEKILSDVAGLSNVDIIVDGNSVSITFHTESALSADSFVASKTGFPEKSIDILKKLTEFDHTNIVISTVNQDSIAISSYFTKTSLDRINFDRWDDLNSLDAFEFYNMADAYHIRLGVWESLGDETKQLIGNMNKQSSNDFWMEHGFTY